MRISSSIGLAVLCLGVGGAGGWVLRGAPNPGDSPTDAGTKSGASARQSGDEHDSGFAAPPRFRPGDHQDDESGPSPDDREEYAATLRADLNWRVNSWKTSLGLSPEQLASLQDSIGKTIASSLDEMSAMNSESPPAGSPQEDLTTALTSILDPQQTEKFNSWKERKEQLQHESQATLKLAELEDNLILEPDQRDAIHQALLQDAEANPAEDSRPPAPMIDPQMISDLSIKLGDGMDDPKQFQDAARVWIEQKISNEMTRMKTYLRPDQLETYRHLLERKYTGWLESNP